MQRTRYVAGAMKHSLGVGLVLALSSVAVAQEIPDTGGKVFGVVGGSFGDGGPAIAVTGGAGIRVSRHLGIDFEVFHVSGLEPSERNFFIQELTFAPPTRIVREGGLTSYLTTLNVDFPVGDRLVPFISGGGGIGRLSETISFDFARVIDLPPQLVAGRPLIFPPGDITRSETGLVLTLGGGLDIRLWKGLGVGAEARWLRLLANRANFDFAQVGTRVSYRF